jgi:hypothetical protein
MQYCKECHAAILSESHLVDGCKFFPCGHDARVGREELQSPEVPEEMDDPMTAMFKQLGPFFGAIREKEAERLTKREQFQLAAMQGLCTGFLPSMNAVAKQRGVDSTASAETIDAIGDQVVDGLVDIAIKIADKMLEAGKQ